ncbi:hypothetical protein A3306_07345 [Rickettsia bellii]|uniref:Uncharacterized protein n=2 Tax=Rickettsia bellii TaxID=33990 RepID=A0A0F3QGB6_RICBE|nr:hypothetical protein [Rickettsia bellii]ARD86907.1 hypothetical protein A3306_07345 [Rickettsia bellii]KJV89346.1 hypothetical protein RBEAN4_0322 [Rickettsia bellii str. RML An4]KJV91610.1 hypothetical protein RBEMOGI_0216 [Rickettsia bellii str. RML Mogi]
MKKYKLTEEEQEILDYFEKDELLELPKKELENQINIAKTVAANFFKKWIPNIHKLQTVMRVAI